MRPSKRSTTFRILLAAAACLTLWLIFGASRVFAGGPVIFWASDPIRPGEAVMVVGDSFGEKPAVEVVRLADEGPGGPFVSSPWPADARGVETLQATPTSLKFVLPAELPQGVFAFRISTPEGETTGLLNRPHVWWAQGDRGAEASAGGWVRLFGKDFQPAAKGPGPPGAVQLDGPRKVTLPAEIADDYSLRVVLPEDLPPGEYQLSVRNGFGGEAAGSEPVGVTVAAAPAWPQDVFSVADFGAIGDGIKDDTAAVLMALEKAKAAGGGIVLFPPGRYRLSDGLAVPRFTVLRGEDRQRTALCWTDFEDPPEALVRGTNSFGMEELTLYARNHRHVIAGDLGAEPEAGNVFLRGVRVRADAYRGHLKPEEVDARFREALHHSTGGGDTVRLGGPNVQITDCDLYGSGRVLFLSRVRGGLVARNRLYNGRWGWYCISGSDGLVFEDNALTGGDLMSTGGGLNCLDGSSYSQNVYYARNELRLLHGWDREAMTSDAGGETYFGKLASVDGTRIELAGDPTTRRDPVGAGVFVLDGRGAGQVRRVVSHEGRTLQIDRPWLVEPDQDSDVVVNMFQGRYLLVGNTFEDTGAVQLYGTSIECVLAGNTGTRMAGFRGLGLWYHGYQPSWFCQFFDNRITEGNYYHFDSAREAILEVYGASREPYEGPLNRGAVLRRNTLQRDAHVRVAGTCRDVVVEGNTVENAGQGIFVSRTAENVLLRDNRFENVGREIVDEEAMRRAAEERMKKYLGRQDPVAVWSFESLVGNHFADSSGNGFFARIEGAVSRVEEGVRGKAVKLDGTGYLRVEEPAVFNAPDVTVSLWINPGTAGGRRGLVAKRFAGTAAPLVLSQNGAAIRFEATEAGGPWTFNFSGPAVLEKGKWTHVAAVVQSGKGVALYANGEEAATIENAAPRATNGEPLILGREAWGGDPPTTDGPGLFVGLMDEVKVWTRALTAEEIHAEYAAGAK